MTPTIHNLAGDIASRVQEMARDSQTNNADLIERLLRPLYEELQQRRECDCQRYKKLAKAFSAATPHERMIIWTELEQIKNSYGGMPPA